VCVCVCLSFRMCKKKDKKKTRECWNAQLPQPAVVYYYARQDKVYNLGTSFWRTYCNCSRSERRWRLPNDVIGSWKKKRK
jgi:hypothetical protein